MSYIPHSQKERNEMLESLGLAAEGVEGLFEAIPDDLRLSDFDIPHGRSELEVIKHIEHLAGRNTDELINFVGGGFYDHFIPAAVDAIASRPEFYTAYTPYQAEASQGTLQATYEFQSCICRLTDMEAANASLYDGGTALYEAAMMAMRVTRRNKIITEGGVSPIYRKMMYSYTSNLSIEFVETPAVDFGIDREKILQSIDEDTAAVILQNPNFFGVVDDHTDIIEKCHEKGVLVIESVYPVSLGLLKTPGSMGADIVTGEGQSLGIPLSFGGPYLGFMATRRKYIRKMPGRIVGKSEDAAGKRSFVLTLQTREQHIRREKSTSNICSNEALCALRAVAYMSLLGKDGFAEAARGCLDRCEYAKAKLDKIKGVEVNRSGPTFNEFAVRLDKDPDEVVCRLIEQGIAGGFPLGRYYKDMSDYMLIAVTEKRTKQEIDNFATALEEILWT